MASPRTQAGYEKGWWKRWWDRSPETKALVEDVAAETGYTPDQVGEFLIKYTNSLLYRLCRDIPSHPFIIGFDLKLRVKKRKKRSKEEKAAYLAARAARMTKDKNKILAQLEKKDFSKIFAQSVK